MIYRDRDAVHLPNDFASMRDSPANNRQTLGRVSAAIPGIAYTRYDINWKQPSFAHHHHRSNDAFFVFDAILPSMPSLSARKPTNNIGFC